ncbi:MAG: SDR family oxidoreductase [Bacteroidota bacterium]
MKRSQEMQEDFEGQVAIITGAASGIGLEIAQQFAARGGKIVINDIDGKTLREVTNQLNHKAIGILGDASQPKIIQEMITEAKHHFGQLNIVIANAGITTFDRFLDYTSEQFDQLIQLNLKASFFLAQTASRTMIEQKTGGSILLMSSVTGVQAHENLVAYGMTKAALQMLAKALVSELSPHQICINAIAPGATLTERTLNDQDYKQVWSNITPIGRPATVQDIAHAALFLVHPKSKHITGQTLVVDGGWTSVSPSPFEK